MKKLIIITVISLLAACATTNTTLNLGSSNYVLPEKKIVQFPEIGEVAIKSIGERLFSTVTKIEYDAVITDQSVVATGKYIGLNKQYTIKPSVLRLKKETLDGKFYQSQKGVTITGQGEYSTLTGGLFISPSGQQSVYYTIRGSTYSNPLNMNTKLDKITDVELNKFSFEQHLIYLGVLNDVITISYREFKNDMIRDAFSQEIKYDLNQSKIVSFKGAQLEVIEATNNFIKYKVLKQF